MTNRKTTTFVQGRRRLSFGCGWGSCFCSIRFGCSEGFMGGGVGFFGGSTGGFGGGAGNFSGGSGGLSKAGQVRKFGE